MNIGKPYNFILKGNLKENNGVLDLLIPFPEMRQNLWQCCIQDLCCECSEIVDKLISISTNVFNQLTIQNRVQVYTNPIVNVTHIRGNINTKICKKFSRNWFIMNDFDENLKFFFK